MTTPVDTILRHASHKHGADLCQVLRIQPQTFVRLVAGDFRQPEVLAEVRRRLRAAGLLTDGKRDS